MTKIIRVGQMPGRIQEVAVMEGSTIAQAIEVAGLSVQGNTEVKVDGATINDLATPITSETNLILLAEKVKGNAVLRVGQMPGRIQEVAIADGATIAEAIEVAGLAIQSNTEVKVDGTTFDDVNVPLPQGANLILLAEKVKGNN